MAAKSNVSSIPRSFTLVLRSYQDEHLNKTTDARIDQNQNAVGHLDV